jgi:hypothetical protein
MMDRGMRRGKRQIRLSDALSFSAELADNLEGAIIVHFQRDD